MISRACREVAKHTPFLLSELEPRNATTEEELRNGSGKIYPDVMSKMGRELHAFSMGDVESKFKPYFQWLILAHNFTVKESPAAP